MAVSPLVRTQARRLKKFEVGEVASYIRNGAVMQQDNVSSVKREDHLTGGTMWRASMRSFVRGQGFLDVDEASSAGWYKALMFQPKVIAVVVVAGVASQRAELFLALSAILGWNALFPALNPFDALYNAMIAAPPSRACTRTKAVRASHGRHIHVADRYFAAAGVVDDRMDWRGIDRCRVVGPVLEAILLGIRSFQPDSQEQHISGSRRNPSHLEQNGAERVQQIDRQKGKYRIMADLIAQPRIITAAGNKPKQIAEYVGRLNSGAEAISIARMESPSGWSEPGQTPEFDEYSLVLRGLLRVRTQAAVIDVIAGQAIVARKGEWVSYSTPGPEGAQYVAVCLPAFSIELVHRDGPSRCLESTLERDKRS